MATEIEIFLVEDDPFTSTLVCKSLRDHNYKVTAFFNAEDALVAIKKGFPKVIIIDYQLPGMSGIELFDIIKPTMPSASVVIMASSISDGTLVLKFIQKGVRNYVMKDDDFLTSLKEALDDEL